MIKESVQKNSSFSSDEQLNAFYPDDIQQMARRHWTPLIVAQKAAEFLAIGKNVRILDIGSGVGKFCFGAARHRPQAYYYGIEQRKSLIMHAEAAKEKLWLKNVSFIHGNFTAIDFRNYDHFYFYNAFYENLKGTPKIDNSIAYSEQLYQYYTHYLFRQLQQKPSGTRLVTFHSMEDEMPSGYHLWGVELAGLLKYWIKE